MTHAWQQYETDFVLLLEAGFIAVNQADEDSALKLFQAAELLRPAASLPKVGFGYLHLHKLELKEAVHRFETVLEKEPENEMARALLGLSISMMPNAADKGEKILLQTEKSSDPGIKSLSMTAVDFIRKFIKKTPGPAGQGKH